MPIGQFLPGLRFDPETKRVMGIAFEVARINLRPADRSDLADELIAHNIIYLAKAGERDFDRLCEGGLNVLRKAGSLTVPTPQRSYRHDAHEPGGTTSDDASTTRRGDDCRRVDGRDRHVAQNRVGVAGKRREKLLAAARGS